MTVLQSHNPSTLELLWEGKPSDAAAVDQAVATARQGFNDWSATTLQQRIDILQHYQTIVKERKDEIAALIAKENGKMLREAEAEAGALAAKVSISIDAYHTRTGRSEADMGNGISRSLRHKPLGVMAVFGPYNFPMHLPNGHIIPALLAGNSIVFKPSEETPACGALLVSLLHEAGVPEHVVQIVQGSRDTGISLSQHADINGVLFTGSYATGRAIHRALAGRPEIMLALEMGGNNPLIVYDVNDVENAARMIVDSAYVTTGQRCTCARRLILPAGDRGHQITEAVAALIDRMIIADAFDTRPAYMGPLINNTQADQMLQAEQVMTSNGARVIRAAKRLESGKPFVTPSLLDVTATRDLDDEEIFAPLLQVHYAQSIQDAITLANNTKYGLSAGLISDNQEHWDAVRMHVRAGILNFNRPLTGAASASPFGGPGCSGNLRPSAYYAADYCAYPVASLFSNQPQALELPGFESV